VIEQTLTSVNHAGGAYSQMKLSLVKILSALLLTFFLIPSLFSRAMVKGPCSDCHTMHNSQGGTAMTFDGSTTPNGHLLRTSGCVGCHAQGGSQKIIAFSGNDVPQVMHTDTTDLAAGNFGYIDGSVGNGASQTKGHNVIDLVLQDTIHLYPPGGPYKNAPAKISHPYSMPPRFTCAGLYGCHGNTHIVDPIASMQGAHHESGGNLPPGDTVGTSYRFLIGITGLEIDDWQNTDKNHHNEYKSDWGGATQLPGWPNQSSCGWCHGPDNPWHGNSGTVMDPGSSMADFCMRCHPHFHSYVQGGGVWFQHPENVRIPNWGEYADYTEYNIDAPVARRIIPTTPSSIVTPSNGVANDYVTCISCHKAHATDHPDLLRWDYANIEAGGGVSTGEGCIICHTKKDD
jgi:hypothetical protein